MNRLLFYFNIAKRKSPMEILYLIYNKIRTGIRNVVYNNSKICYAPFRSMYFDFNGNALPCCENRVFNYGRYPDQSLSEIWFGQKIKQFRNLISKEDLEHGCSSCAHNIKSGNRNIAKAYIYRFAPPASRYPTRMEFQLSNLCNLECFMCDEDASSMIRKSHPELPPIKNPYDDNFVMQLEEFIPHMKQAHFVGGEPFMIKIFYKIWQKIIELNSDCLIIVQTNATLLNDEIKSLLEKGKFSLNISIDSLTKDNYEKIRRNASFDTTIENIKYFIDYCKRKRTELIITACPMQQNWEEIPDLINFSNKNDIKIYFHTVVSPIRSSFLGFSAEELNNVHTRLSTYKFPVTTFNEENNFKSFENLLFQIKHFYTDKTRIKKEYKNRADRFEKTRQN